jgi:hypothetical protein
MRWFLVLVGFQGETICWSMHRHLSTVGADLCVFISMSATMTASSAVTTPRIVSITSAPAAATTAATATATATSVLGHCGEQVRVLLHDNFVLLSLGLEFCAEH